jgi:hypothetical protein
MKRHRRGELVLIEEALAGLERAEIQKEIKVLNPDLGTQE